MRFLLYFEAIYVPKVRPYAGKTTNSSQSSSGAESPVGTLWAMTSVTVCMAFRGEPEGGLLGRSCIPLPKGVLAARAVTPAPESSPWSAVYLEPKHRDRACSHVVHGRVSRFAWRGTSTLSIKTVFSGVLQLQSGSASYRIEPGHFLVLNSGSEYGVTIDSGNPVMGLSVFFDDAMVTSALSNAAGSSLGSDNWRKSNRFPCAPFFERVNQDPCILDLLSQLHLELSADQTHAGTVRRLHAALLDALLELHRRQCNELQSVPAVRAVTKEELYRSLYRARDHAYASLGRNVTVDELAYVACLSTNYFLRSFRALFGQTPHQYLIDCRLQRACQLLTTTQLGISEICCQVGFQSLGSFSWLFKRRIGLSPEKYRCYHVESELNVKKVDESLANLAGLGHTLCG